MNAYSNPFQKNTSNFQKLYERELRVRGLDKRYSEVLLVLSNNGIKKVSYFDFSTTYSVEFDVFVSVGMNQKDLSEKIGISDVAVGNAIEGAISEGFVYRIKDADDARSIRIVITEKGMAEASKFRDALLATKSYFFRNLADDEFCVFLNLLKRLCPGMEKYFAL